MIAALLPTDFGRESPVTIASFAAGGSVNAVPVQVRYPAERTLVGRSFRPVSAGGL